MYELETFTNQFLDPINPDINRIELLDIAISLGNQCRFAGHTQSFYSVAEHCLRVADLLPDELKLTGLLHDASEAYMLDLPRPLKNRLPEYKSYESKLLKMIMYKFGGIYPLPEEVIMADDNVLEWEFKNIKHSKNHKPLPQSIASDLYLNEVKRLMDVNF